MLYRGYPNLKGTIFIVTYGRSGSTLLQSILQTIPGADIAGENFFALEPLYIAGRRAHRSKNEWGQEPRPANHPWYKADSMDPKRFESRLGRVFMEEIVQPSVDARWAGFKEIRYDYAGDDFNSILEFCTRVFPNPYFIFNSRSAEAVSKSRWWNDHPKEFVYTLVETMDKRFADFHAKHPNNSFCAVYEDIVADPTCLKPCFEMFGETFNLRLVRKVMKRKLDH